MTRIIINGCNGKMGQVVSGLVAADEQACVVAGIDVSDHIANPYPVFKSLAECDVEADVGVDFSFAGAVDAPSTSSRLASPTMEDSSDAHLLTTSLAYS